MSNQESPTPPPLPSEAIRINAEAQEIIAEFGDKVADLFEQMERGNWADDLGHPVSNNTAMMALLPTMERAMQHRAALKSLTPSSPAPEAKT